MSEDPRVDGSPADSELPFREDLRILYRALQPKSIACLYADDRLADIPLDEFLRGQSRVCLVDWHPERPREVIANSLVQKEGEDYACAASALHDLGQEVCESFVPPTRDGVALCRSFVLLEGFPPRCVNYVPGPDPRVMIADGSLGRAACFAMRAEELVAVARTPLHALDLALAECGRCSVTSSRLALEDDSLDLVVSQLAPSRMMSEPFGHFDRLMTRRFGAWRTSSGRATVLRRSQGLRAGLFRMQFDGHVQEIHRLVKKEGGRVYFATEPLDAPLAGDGWSIEKGIPLAFERLGGCFDFDFDSFPPSSFLRRIASVGGRPRIVQAALLRARGKSTTAGDRSFEVGELEGGLA